jgi:DNA gyrase subunit A
MAGNYRRQIAGRISQRSAKGHHQPRILRHPGQAILDLQLRRLSALERQKILDEYEALIKHIAELENILANENVLRQVIVDELEEIKKNLATLDERHR